MPPVSLGLGSIFGPLLNLFTRSRERRAVAAAEFRAVVLKELSGLYPEPAPWPDGSGIDRRLRAAFPALQAAVEQYRPYLSKKELKGFNDAWRWYRSAWKRPEDVQSYSHYMNGTSTSTGVHGGLEYLRPDGPANFKRNVERLLSFAADV
jgi:hypothetical protein